MKSHLRFSKASGSDRAKVELLIRRGWQPGQPAYRYHRPGLQARLRDIARKGEQVHEP